MTFDHPHLHHLIVLGDVRVEDRLGSQWESPAAGTIWRQLVETINWKMDGNLHISIYGF